MSGHNKWSKIKNQKAGTDAARAKIFTFHSRKISLAIKEKKGIEQAIESAKKANVPSKVIERALNKSSEKNNYSEMIFECFLLNGKINIIIIASTNNNARTANVIKNIIERHGGKLGVPGSISYLFNKFGSIRIKNTTANENIVLESGACDFEEEGEDLIVKTSPSDLQKVASFLEKHGIEILEEIMIYEPIDEIHINAEENAHLDNVLTDLSLQDDVESVFTNAKT